MTFWYSFFAISISVVCIVGDPVSRKNCKNQKPTCENVNCGAGEECFLKEIDCRTNPPCPKSPTCRPSCQLIDCREGYFCKDGKCIEEPPSFDKCALTLCQTGTRCIDGVCYKLCGDHQCEDGEECFWQDVDCFAPPCDPVPICRPAKNCTSIDCKTGNICSDGKCIPDPCTNHNCNEGYECYLEQVQCIRAPCPPIASCRLINKCDIVRCKGDHICSDGKCIPNPCIGYNCRSGEECYLKEVDCFAAPCPPLPGCRPILTCATIKCRSDYYCFNRKCLPWPTCKDDTCEPGYECYIDRPVCDVPPCPPPTTACRVR